MYLLWQWHFSEALAQTCTCLASIVHARVGRYSGLGHARSGESNCFYYSWKKVDWRGLRAWDRRTKSVLQGARANGDKLKLASRSCMSTRHIVVRAFTRSTAFRNAFLRVDFLIRSYETFARCVAAASRPPARPGSTHKSQTRAMQLGLA
jgi:hypothetical protein